jgi:hypothetical protein
MILATIQHSGTFEAIGFLNRPLWPLELASTAPDGAILFCHLNDFFIGPVCERLARGEQVVTTYRDPEEIRGTWTRNGMDLAELDRQLANYARLLELKPTVLNLGSVRGTA